MSEFRTDALRPSGLPSANLGRARALVSGSGSGSGGGGGAGAVDGAAGGEGSGGAKTKFWDDWNARIDGEVKAVVEGLGQVIELTNIDKIPTPHAPSLISLHLPLRTSQLIRAAQQLRDTAHELRLMLLLSDEVDIAIKRDEEARLTRREVNARRGQVVERMRRLMGATEEPPDPPVNGAMASANGHAADHEGKSETTAPRPPAEAGNGMDVDVEEAREDEDDDDEDGDMEEVG